MPTERRDKRRARSPESPGVEGVRLLYLANLRREKGIFDLLDALRLLKGAAGGWEIRVVGEGTPAIIRSLEAEASALGAAGGPRVTVLPPRYESRKWSEYENADAFVFPPRASEGQPLVLLEAMAAGLPIVTTNVGGIPHTVRDGVEGLSWRRFPRIISRAPSFASARMLRCGNGSAARLGSAIRLLPARAPWPRSGCRLSAGHARWDSRDSDAGAGAP